MFNEVIVKKVFEFSEWLNCNTTLSNSSIYKYSRAVNTISNDMQEINLISKSLFDMNIVELDISTLNILTNQKFIEKNQKGNNMYSCALKHLRYFILNTNDSKENELDIVKDIKNSNIDCTEKEAIIKARNGQGIYRDSLLKKYNSTCIMTGINNSKLLIASHIKPWVVSNNTERTDVSNGLLLCANMDKLFDSGLISFRNNGSLLISSFVGKRNECILNIKSGQTYNLNINNTMCEYLDYHRDILFIK